MLVSSLDHIKAKATAISRPKSSVTLYITLLLSTMIADLDGGAYAMVSAATCFEESNLLT
jgi:hypothetical protein